MHSLNRMNIRTAKLQLPNFGSIVVILGRDPRINRWSWDVLGSVGNAPNRSRAAILEDVYSSLAFGKKLYLVGRMESVQIYKRGKLSAGVLRSLSRYQILDGEEG